ncbi:hypothetical protein SPAN111604_10315 [Sphingomonas antarctica]|uniref:DOMON-like domain-containing protein n=1 Tax=Sphingomonas antarctica TaxID=2040274 RepID=UPI0039ED44C4
MQVVSLIPHPSSRPHRDVAVQVTVEAAGRGYALAYQVAGVSRLCIDGRGVGRTDELWRHTCFELFVRTVGATAYREFNFAPTAAWAMYDFDDWRSGMRSPPVKHTPGVVDGRISGRKPTFGAYALYVTIDAALLPQGPMIAAPTAVIEAIDGSKSYWAMAHPPGEPNFHHPACFALDLSPPTAA